MAPISAFLEHNFVLVYFFYGLAFFAMGLAILLEPGRRSDFRLARALLPLAGFGIVHGLHEWFEMFQLLDAAGATNIPTWLLRDEVRVAHLALSFALLIVFGVRLIYANRRANGREQRFALAATGAFVAVWLLSWLITIWVYAPARAESLRVGDVLGRYILGMPGALLAGWAILLEQRTFTARGMAQFGRALRWAALALIFYGSIGQIFTPPLFLFPANVLNTVVFWEITGLPIQFFRALAASLMAFFVIRALRAFDLESQERLHQANQERLAAQEAALAAQRKAHLATESLNQELQEAVHRLTTLHNLARQLAASLDQERILYEVFPAFIRGEARIGAGMILLRDQPHQPLTIASQTVCDAPPQVWETMLAAALQLGEAVTAQGQPLGWVDEGRPPVTLETDGTTAAPTPMATWPPLRIVGLPLTLGPALQGCLMACAPPPRPAFGAQDISLLSAVAGQMSTALQNAVLYQQTRERDVLRGELLRRVVVAQEQERQRIARELHDGPGQSLTALGLGLAAAGEWLKQEPALAVQQLGELKDLNTASLQELHDIIADLRPAVLDDLGLVAALRSQVQSLERRAQVHTSFTIQGARRRLPPEIETVVFRIAQEALTNIAKHAGARTAEVQITFGNTELELMVRDDGRGFDPDLALGSGRSQRRAWGLLGMQERVSLVGGRCDIQSQPQAGTAIRVWLPLDAPPPAEGVSDPHLTAGRKESHVQNQNPAGG